MNILLIALAAFLPYTLGQVTQCEADCAEYFDALGTGRREWRLVFRALKGIGKSVYDAYVDGTGVPDQQEPGCRTLDPTLPCTHHYRNNVVLNFWSHITEVAVVIYKGSSPVHNIVFDGTASTYMNFFSQSKVKNSTWNDLKTVTPNYFSIKGYTSDNVQRRFYIEKSHANCPNDEGWLSVTDAAPGTPCPWESYPPWPVIVYSAGNTYQKWSTGHIGQGDMLAVFVKQAS